MSKTSASIAALKAQIAEIRAAAKIEREVNKQTRAAIKAERAAAREVKIAAAAERKAVRIAKLKAKLISLETGNVGSKAIKMNKKPSACTTVYQMAA